MEPTHVEERVTERTSIPATYIATVEGCMVRFTLTPEPNPRNRKETWAVVVEGLQELYSPHGIASQDEAYEVGLKLAHYKVGIDRERARFRERQ